MNMNDELDLAKLNVKNINDIADIKSNPVIEGLMSTVRAVPVIGDLIDSSINTTISKFQHEKEKEFIDVILKDKGSITSEEVNDIEFIFNYAKTMEAVKRLTANDKIKYFGNLIRNGYLSGEKISNNDFEEYMDILNTMSYREIESLVDFKTFSDDSNGKKSYNPYPWPKFQKEYAKKLNISPNEVYGIFMRIKQTGLVEELFETESGDVDDNTVSELSVDGGGFRVVEYYEKFKNIVLRED